MLHIVCRDDRIELQDPECQDAAAAVRLLGRGSLDIELRIEPAGLSVITAAISDSEGRTVAQLEGGHIDVIRDHVDIACIGYGVRHMISVGCAPYSAQELAAMALAPPGTQETDSTGGEAGQ